MRRTNGRSIPQWSAYFGVRNERVRSVSSGVSGDFTARSSVTTPLLHLNYKIDPKGRDLIRGSLTRSYKLPNVEQYIARPTINTNYPTTGPNTQTAPRPRRQPAAARPELATGLDLAWENYLKAGGLVSVGRVPSPHQRSGAQRPELGDCALGQRRRAG